MQRLHIQNIKIGEKMNRIILMHLDVSESGEKIILHGILMSAQNAMVTTFVLSHPISLILACSHKDELIEMLNSIPNCKELIHEIHCTNIKVKCTNFDFIDQLLNLPNSANTEHCTLLKINVRKYQDLYRLYQILDINKWKNIYILPKFNHNLYHMVSYDILFFLTTAILPSNYGGHPIIFRHSFDLNSLPAASKFMVYHGCVVDFDSRLGKLSAVEHEMTIDHELCIPVLSFDLESISDNLLDLPQGVAPAEKMVSFGIYAEFLDKTYSWIYYLRPSKNCDPALIERQVRVAIDKAKVGENKINMQIKYFNTEADLLFALFELLNGKVGEPTKTISYILTGHSNWPYFLVCQNFLGYDLPFLMSRLMNLQYDQLLNQSHFSWSPVGGHRFNREEANYLIDTDNFRFDTLGMSIDSMYVFKRQGIQNLSLAALTAANLPKDEQKMTNFDVVSIRIPYLLETSNLCIRNKEKLLSFMYEPDLEIMDATHSYSLQNSDAPELFEQLYRNKGRRYRSTSVYQFYTMLLYQFYDVYSLSRLSKRTNLIGYCRNMASYTQLPMDLAAVARVSCSIPNMIATFAIGSYCLYSELFSSTIYKMDIDEENEKIVRVHPQHYKATETNSLWYPGAAVLTKPGVYTCVHQFDWHSYYPSMMVTFNFAPDNVALVTCDYLKKLLYRLSESLKSLSNSFEPTIEFKRDWILKHGLHCYIAEENPDLETDLNKELGYYHYLQNHSHQVGRLVYNVDDLNRLPETKPLMIRSVKRLTNWPVPEMLSNFLLERSEMKKSLKIPGTLKSRPYLKAREKAIKILINSTYGVFKFFAPMIGPCITLFCRKVLIHMCRVAPILYLVDLRSRKMFGLTKETESLTNENLEAYLNYVRMLSPFTYNQVCEWSKLSEYCKKLHDYAKEHIIDADTDSFQVVVDSEDIGFEPHTFSNKYLNNEMITYCGGAWGKSLILEPLAENEKHHLLILLKKKRYIGLETRIDVEKVRINDYCLWPKSPFSYKMVNIGKNALEPIKHILRYTLDTLILYYYYYYLKKKDARTMHEIFTQENYFHACFDFLYRVDDVKKLSYPLPLNNIVTQTPRRAYINSITDAYVGKIGTFFVYSLSDPVYHYKFVTEKDYLDDGSNMLLYYPEYLKNYIKIINDIVNLLLSQEIIYKIDDLHDSFLRWMTSNNLINNHLNTCTFSSLSSSSSSSLLLSTKSQSLNNFPTDLQSPTEIKTTTCSLLRTPEMKLNFKSQQHCMYYTHTESNL